MWGGGNRHSVASCMFTPVFLQGVNVREKAKQLVTLLKDEERLREERIHALKTKEKMAQTSSGEMWTNCLQMYGYRVLSSITAYLSSLQPLRLLQHPAWGAACQQAHTLEGETRTRPGHRALEKKICSSNWLWP